MSLAEDRKFYIVCGHYGCGKSNFSLNLAIDRARKGRKVMLVDLDLVNPYFLSSGYKEKLEGMGITVIAPMFANTNVETPGLPANINMVFETDADVIMDVGGDDAGSIVLGRYARQLENVDYEMLYLVNKYRNLTATAEETVEIMNEIQSASRCKVGAVVNNSHLKYETTWETVENSLAYAEEIAKLAEVPLWATTIPTFLYKDEKVQALTEQYDSANWYPVEIYVRAPWESGVPEFDKL
ncbi:MAG: ParA family protein [Lachnospiraceae bacterium]|nr:ParA family protein [Lachnospiraceae bacterium]